MLVEVAAAHERDAYGLEIIGRRDADIGAVFLGATGTIERARAVAAGERETAHSCRMLNSWHPGHALHDLLIKLKLLILIGFRGGADIKYEEPTGVEARIDSRQVREALDHQARTDQQDQG